MWKKTPVPLSLRLHVFNLTNPDEFKNGSKPVLQELGPYVWRCVEFGGARGAECRCGWMDGVEMEPPLTELE